MLTFETRKPLLEILKPKKFIVSFILFYFFTSNYLVTYSTIILKNFNLKKSFENHVSIKASAPLEDFFFFFFCSMLRELNV